MKSNRALIVVLLMLVTSSVAQAEINQFAGKWKNVDPKTRGLTTLNIEVNGTRVKIQAFGRCHPTDCAWGYAAGTAYAPRVESNMIETAQVISSIYLSSFSQMILIIRPAEDDQIEVEVLTKFTDESRRSNTRGVYRFQRAEAVDQRP